MGLTALSAGYAGKVKLFRIEYRLKLVGSFNKGSYGLVFNQ